MYQGSPAPVQGRYKYVPGRRLPGHYCDCRETWLSSSLTPAVRCCLLFSPPGTEDLPEWLSPSWAKMTFLTTKLRAQWSKSQDTLLRELIKDIVPKFSSDILIYNSEADCLHMQMLRQSHRPDGEKWFRRAMQHGSRHQTFPLFYDWDELSSELRKFVTFRFINMVPGSHSDSLRLFPCTVTDMIDYLEWLPHAGVRAGWSVIRHYYGQLKLYSQICGFGDIIGADKAGFEAWRSNFAANVQIIRQPRGGDLPLRPWYLRRLAAVYSENTPFNKLMKCVVSLMWFTALRVCHWSPESLDKTDHLVEWEFIASYSVSALGAQRAVLHFEIPTAKNRQEQAAVSWSTAVCCICESYDCSEAEFADLTALCPVCATERWRQAFPCNIVAQSLGFLCILPATNKPFLRRAFNKELRRALDLALAYLPDVERALIVSQLAGKSWRSGAATQVVTEGNAGFVAAAFLGHADTKTTKQYYHKGGDLERLQLAPALAKALVQ
jgi:hypothetical protein